MSGSVSSSVDAFVDNMSEEPLSREVFTHNDSDEQCLSSRRRLENRLAERSLEKDVREFDFDI